MSSSPSPEPSGAGTPDGGRSPRGTSPKAQGRKKIPIDRIQDDRSRYVTFYKRKGGLIKKAMELSVLCDCEISLIIFNSAGKMFDYSSHNMEKTIQRYLDCRDKPHKSLHNRDYDKTFGRKNSKSPTRSNSMESGAESRDLNPSDEDDFYEEMAAAGKRAFDDTDETFGDECPRSPGKKQNVDGTGLNFVLPGGPSNFLGGNIQQQQRFGFDAQLQQQQPQQPQQPQPQQQQQQSLPFPTNQINQLNQLNNNLDIGNMGFLNQTPLFQNNQRSLSHPGPQNFQQQLQMQQQYQLAQLQAQQQQLQQLQQMQGLGQDRNRAGASNVIVTGENWDQVTGQRNTSPKQERPILVVQQQQGKRRGSRDDTLEGLGGGTRRPSEDMIDADQFQ